jgi:hypothetical protein
MMENSADRFDVLALFSSSPFGYDNEEALLPNAGT